MDNFLMFGKTYNTFGSTESNFLIKTKGDLKVQIGNKFIDILKNGKIVNSNEIKVVSSSDSVKNSGIFIVKNDKETSLWINGIKLDNNDNNSLSYDIQEDITEDQRNNALKNLGIYFDTLQDLYNSELTTGIFYVKDQNKQYYYSNGEYIPYDNQESQIDLLWYEGN